MIPHRENRSQESQRITVYQTMRNQERVYEESLDTKGGLHVQAQL